MSENATGEAAVTPLTPENAREVFMDASRAFLNPWCGNEQQTLREQLLQILQNNAYRDMLAACVDEDIVIKAFTGAAAVDDVELLQAFYDIGMNVDAKNKDGGKTALINASARGSANSVRWLLGHGANVEVQDRFGGTPLLYASQNGSFAIAEMLLQKNANPDLQHKHGMTALMLACDCCCSEVVQLLLSHNADVGLKNKKGQTALDLAKTEEIKELLRNHVNTSYVLK